MHPLLKQGSLNIRSSSEGREEISSAQHLYAEIKSPSCQSRAMTVPARDPPAPTARGEHADSRSLQPSPQFSFGTVLGTRLPPAEPGAVTLAHILRTGGTALAVGAPLPARRAQLQVPHPAPVRADAGRGRGTKAQRHRPGRRIVGAPRGATAGGEPATQCPEQSTEGPDPAMEGLYRQRAELLCRTGPAGPINA